MPHKFHLYLIIILFQHLTVYAPPPQYFQSTLKALAIKFDLDATKESDEICFWKQANPKTKKRREGSEVEILPPDDTVTSSNDLRNDLIE